jgi:hypothetical protein
MSTRSPRVLSFFKCWGRGQTGSICIEGFAQKRTAEERRTRFDEPPAIEALSLLSSSSYFGIHYQLERLRIVALSLLVLQISVNPWGITKYSPHLTVLGHLAGVDAGMS